MTRLLAILALSLFQLSALAAEPPRATQLEVGYLLSRVEASGCSFYRNGTWYDAAHAKAHLQTKYQYLAARNLIATADDFIDKAATASSFSGKAYRIKCGTSPEVESGPWLHE